MKFWASLFLILFNFGAKAELKQDSLKISLLTCGVGDQLYSLFGHSAIRVQNFSQGTDEVYNYGMFNFSDPDFYMKFSLGKLDYYVAKEAYLYFLSAYEADKRRVDEQVLQLGAVEQIKVVAFLEQNLRPENRSYKYDFLFDNCATRIRDIFPSQLGQSFVFGPVFTDSSAVSFRTILNHYLQNSHWPRFGINLVLGARVDQIMSNDEAMFLPDLLKNGFAGATLNGKKVVGDSVQLLSDVQNQSKGLNGPMWAMVAILVITMVIFFMRSLQFLKHSWVVMLLIGSGLLGFVLVFTCGFTEHQSFRYNLNLLWALPTNLLLVFTIKKPRKWHTAYALGAIGLLMVSVLLHIISVQVLPLKELLPWLIALVYAYLYIYKRGLSIKAKTVS